MRFVTRQGSGAVVAALAVGLATLGAAHAQEQDPLGMSGLIIGEVDRCINGAETPASQVAVGIVGGSGNLGRTDVNGQFFIALPPGQYTIVANADDGTTANRQYVPVEAGEALDIGILDLGGGLMGCGLDTDISQPVLPTFTPAPTAVPEVATPTPAPTAPLPTATPVPADQAPAPDQPAPDQPMPDQPPRPDAGG